jgi:cytochrome b561
MLLFWATGDSVFNHFAVPANDPVNSALAAKLQSVHSLIGWIIVATVGVHVVGVLFHKLVLHDAVLARMLLRR